MITVADCLALPELRAAVMVAGRDGLTHPVRLAHVIDEPDVAAWAAPDVVVLTTGHNQPNNAEFWSSLIPALSKQRIAALFVALGRYIESIPDEAQRMANQYALPIITLPWSLPFVTVTESIHRLIVDDNRETWARVSEMQIRVTESAVRADTLEELLGTFSVLLSRSVDLVEPSSVLPEGQIYPLGSPDLRRWHLWIASPPLSAPEQVIARQMAGVLAVYLLQQKIARQTEFELQSAMLERILLGQWQDDTAHRQRIRLLGFHVERPHRLMLLSLPDFLRVDPRNTTRYEGARELLQELVDWEERLINVTPHGLALLIGSTANRPSSLKERLKPYFERFPDSTGLISGSLKLDEIPTSFETMSKMLPLLEPGALHLLDEAVFPTVVAELPVDLMNTFVHITWGRIHDAVLHETLVAYVRSGGRRLEAANRLNVHRNTVANRIEQIEAQLGHRLDAAFLTQLDLAYRWLMTRSPGELLPPLNE